MDLTTKQKKFLKSLGEVGQWVVWTNLMYLETTLDDMQAFLRHELIVQEWTPNSILQPDVSITEKGYALARQEDRPYDRSKKRSATAGSSSFDI